MAPRAAPEVLLIPKSPLKSIVELAFMSPAGIVITVVLAYAAPEAEALPATPDIILLGTHHVRFPLASLQSAVDEAVAWIVGKRYGTEFKTNALLSILEAGIVVVAVCTTAPLKVTSALKICAPVQVNASESPRNVCLIFPVSCAITEQPAPAVAVYPTAHPLCGVSVAIEEGMTSLAPVPPRDVEEAVSRAVPSSAMPLTVSLAFGAPAVVWAFTHSIVGMALVEVAFRAATVTDES